MPKKTKRQAQLRRRTGPNTAVAAGTPARTVPNQSAVAGEGLGEVGTDAVVAPGEAPRTGAVELGRRRIGRLDGSAEAARRTRPVRTGNVAAQFEPLDPADAAIPFDRVPYVPSDLRRVAVIASFMVVIIIVAAILVSKYVK